MRIKALGTLSHEARKVAQGNGHEMPPFSLLFTLEDSSAVYESKCSRCQAGARIYMGPGAHSRTSGSALAPVSCIGI